ncbi:MAG TPA: tRNA pseudouridine(55) synthase TruB [Casimicrobiaceae bacterium]|nr:tRNA pseudouridine(55) synthase TruB [Casimicrobiaceae bacterium]
MALARAPRRRVDGVLLLDKPHGLTSNAALQRAKHLLAAEKAGHTGTLDPLATGLLPLCFGEATKFAHTLLDARKEYFATVSFGVATDTGDGEGETLATCAVAFSRDELAAVLPRFVGTIAQVPPRFAALKHRGRNYYEYARAGVDIPRPARDVRVDAVELVGWEPPQAKLRVACGKGTYIRTLAEDIAAALGSCAHLAALRRTVAGPFSLDRAVTLGALEEMELAGRDALLLPVDAALAGVERLDVDGATESALVHGRVGNAPVDSNGRYRCYNPAGRFVGLVEASRGELRAVRLARADGIGASGRR